MALVVGREAQRGHAAAERSAIQDVLDGALDVDDLELAEHGGVGGPGVFRGGRKQTTRDRQQDERKRAHAIDTAIGRRISQRSS